MANTSDNLRRLYDNGLKYFNLPDFDAFSKDMQDETKRKRFYTNMQAHYNLPEFEQFSQDIGMIQPAQPAPAQPQAATPSVQPTVQAPQAPQPTAAEPTQPTVRTAAQPSSLPGWGWVDEAASQWTANAQPTVTTPSVQQPQRTITQADRLAVNTQLDPIMPEAEPTEGEVVRPKQVLHPALEGIVEDADGQLTPQWRLNDGSLTTDRDVAGREEGAARAYDAYSEMASRMRRAGFDPNDDDDVRLQQSIDAGATEETTRTILARAGINVGNQEAAISWMHEKGLDPNNLNHARWYANGDMESITRYRLEKAEARLKELQQERQQRDNERANSGGFLEQLGRNVTPPPGIASPPPRQMGIAEDPLDTKIAAATAEVGMLAKALTDYEQTRAAAEGSWYGNIGRGVWHGVTDPDNWTFGLYSAGFNEALDDRTWNSIREDAETLAQQAGDPGFVYNSFRFIGDMMANPVLLPGAGAAGKLTGKLATNLVNRTMLKGITPNIAQRLLLNTAKGRAISRYGIGALQSAGFFAAFDGLQDMRDQLENGGYYDEEGLFHEGFSWAHVAGKAGHGALIGGAMGVFGAAVGNTGDWAVKSIGRTALKPGSKAFAETATRAGQKLVAFEGEATIFAAEDIYRFQTMKDKDFDKFYAEQFGYADLTGEARDQAREAARNSLAWDAWTDSQANLLGIKIGGKMQHPIRAFRSARETIDQLRQNDEREHRTLPERVTMMMERSPFDVALTKDELEEIQSKYGNLAEILRKMPKLDGALVKPGGQRIPGYEEFNQLIDDKSISQSARIKAYYIVTGRLLPISKITGMRYQKDTGTGRVILETIGVDGELVSRRTYRDEDEALGDVQGARRQIELNLVDLGESNRQREEFDAKLREACIAVAAERNFPIDGLYVTVARAIESERSGVRLTEEQQAVVDMVREKIGEFEMAAVTDEIRNRINEQYDVDIDEALRKQPYEISNTERSAIEDYINELWHQKGEREYVDYEEQKPPANGPEPPANGPEPPANGPQPPTGEGPNGPGEGPVRPEDAAAAEVMRRTHKGTGKVIRATLKVDDRVVYIVDGNVGTFEDGSVHAESSDDTIIVYDPENNTGTPEFISPDQILRVDEPRDVAVETEEILRSMEAQASQEAPQEAQSAQPEEAYQEAPAEAPREYTAGFAKIRTEDGKERYIYLTGYPTEDGTYEYYFADKRDDLLYATKEQLDNMVIEFTPYEVKKETTQEAAEDPSAQSTPSTQPEEPVEAQPEEPVNAEAEVAPAEEPVKEQTALERIPQDRKGKPIFEKAESPELAWDALVEFAGDAKSAQEIAGMMVANKKRAYETADKAKPKGNDPSEILNSQRSINASKEKAKGEYEMWQKIAAEQQRREDAIESQRAAATRQEAAARAEAEKAEREAREEAERVEREALNGIPEWHMDTPQNARARGSRRHGGQLIKRQEEFSDDVAGNALEVKFSQNDMPIGHYSVIEADVLQPSHMDGQRNPLHFLDEAQPKDRSEAVSVHAARQIAENIRPEEITGSATAYTGAPTVNTRGEVIQGNNRSAALRYLWDNNLPEQQAAYKQYLIDNAEHFGLDPEKIRAMKKPVLVNRLRVEDDEAIRLGQMTAQDTESGGIERIKPKNVAQKLGDEMRTFANLLLRGDEEATFGQLVDRNGAEVLRWMNEKGYISNTQYQSAFDSKGNLTAEAKNDLQKTLYQAVFRGGAQQLEEMFDKLPAKAQRAILATAFRDMDSPLAGKLLPEIQASIAAYVQLMNDPTFANAKNMEELLRAVETFKKATALDDRFETYVPADNFSNFALHLAAMYKASDMSQSTIASYFNRMYDLAQGKTAATLFEEADGTQYALADIVKKVFDFEYKPAKNGNNNDNNGSLDVAVSNTVSQGGEPRGAEPPRGGEQNPTGAEPTDRGGRAESDSRGGGNRPTRGVGEGAAIQNNIPKKKEVTSYDPRTMPDDEKARRGDMLRNAIAIEVAPEQIVATKELSARKAAEQWWDENVPEPAFYDTEIGEVEINKNSIESSLAHKYGQMKLDAITSLIEGFENAVYLGTMPDFARQEGVNNHFFAYPIMYNSKRCYVFCRAMEDANKNRLYVHEVFVSDKIKKGDTLQTAASQPHGGITLYRDILANVLLSGGKITNSALNKQENGAESSEISGAYTIAATSYTNKKGKTTPMHLVTFGRELTSDELRAGKELAKESRGWWDREKGGFMMRSEEAAKELAETLVKGDEEVIADAQPLSVKDMVAVTDSAPKPKKVDLESLVNDLKERGEAKLSDHAKEVEDEGSIDDKQTKQEKKKPKSKWVNDEDAERFEELRERLRKKLRGQANMGVDPEIFSIGVQMSYLMLKKGARKFGEFAKNLIEALGDEVRPYIKSFYNGVRDLPDMTDYEKEMTPYEEVRAFDVMNFDKVGAKDIVATAEHISRELSAEREAKEATNKIKQQRNEQRKKEDDQTSADTEAVINKAEAVASQVESELEAARTEQDAERLSRSIDKEIETVNKQLALLGYYEAEEKDFNEAYGYMRNAERKAVEDAHRLSTQLAEDLGITIDPKDRVRKSKYGFGSKIARSNVAPAGGEVIIKLPLSEEIELSIWLDLDKNNPWIEGGREDRYNDDLVLTGIMYRVEKTSASGMDRYVTSNDYIKPSSTYDELLSAIRRLVRTYLPDDKVEPATPLALQPGEDIVDMAKRVARDNEPKSPKVEPQLPVGDLFGGLFDKGQKEEQQTVLSKEKNDYLCKLLIHHDGLKQKHNDALLLFRSGDKYQVLSNDAEVVSGILDLPISKFTNNGTEIPFVEFPHYALDKYLVRMVKAGQRIAVCESVSEPTKAIDQKTITKQDKNEKRTDLQTRTEETRRGGQQPRPNEPLGEGSEYENERTDGGRVAQRGAVHTVPDTDGSSGISGLPQSERGIKENATSTEYKNLRNNHAERGVDYAPKGEKARIDANIAAIELAKKLLSSGATATPEEMAILRRYSGWGGLGAAFNEGMAWAPNPINKRLRELLTPEEYEAAVMSRNSAYYTPATVIDAMWDIAKALGFKGGNIVEGSAGIGNIIGLMPIDISKRSDIHAVEIDGTTGGILSLLYPDANVEIQGFEKTRIGNGMVDLAITNVPFVTGLRVMDESGDGDLSKKFRDIHDFCIAKNVRKLREGGIGIFITSSGTLDKSQKLRNWLVADKDGNSDVVGVFRMNNQTFGGTAATSDIIVVRKRVNGRKSQNAIDVSTVKPIRTATYKDDRGKEKDLPMLVNSYFVEHPEHMGGEMYFGFEQGDTYRPTSIGLFPTRTADQQARMDAWVQQLAAKDWSKEQGKIGKTQTPQVNESLGAGVKEGSMLIDSEGNLCIARIGRAVPLDINSNKIKGRTKEECFNDYNEIKSALTEVLKYQTENEDNEGLRPLLDRLNRAYDTFVSRYGYLNKNKNLAWLRNDVDFPSIVALETYSEKGTKEGAKIQTYGKTDIFSRRVVDKEREPNPNNIKDGIIASIYKYGRIDTEYLSTQLGKPTTDVEKEIINNGLGFKNPTTGQIEVSYEYLSGNVREKLRQAREANEGGIYDANIKALQAVIPMNIPAHLIKFTIGSSWIEPKLYERYVKERTELDVKLTNAGGTWHMSEPWLTDTPKNIEMGVRSEKLGIFIPGHKIIEAAITNKTITVSKTVKDTNGTHTETDPSATTACATKVDEIRQDFKDWAREQMQNDPTLSMQIEEVYNDKFNNYVPKSIPNEFVPKHFGGAATTVDGKPFQLRPHQAKAVIRSTTQPVLLAHEVGTGKTYTLITTAMEMRRLGTAKKPMIVVQNATVGQFVASAKALYPNAKVLTLEDADRDAEGRKAFYAKIKFNDWDMIVVPQSVFERIPDSIERQTQFIQDKIEEKMFVLEQMRDADPRGKSQIVRNAEREISRLEDEIAQLANGPSEPSDNKNKKDAKKVAIARQNAEVKAKEQLDRETDDVEDFDSMGIDAILVDEAHEYKHLGFATAMQRGVKGIDPSYSKKSQGVYLKTQAVLEKTGGKNVVFATGTPISNTAAEIWTFMRYLMPADVMKEYGIFYFDDFVRNFGNLQQMLEFKTNGKYEEVNRFAGYVNLPELVRIWSSVADTVLTREAGGVSDKIPEMEGGKAEDIFLPQTRALRSIMKFVKEELARYEKMSGKEKKENSHIPLVMYGIAKAAAVDARLVQRDAEDDQNSKNNEAVRQILRSLNETKDYKGTIAVFADNYQNKNSGFNLYEDIRKKLIAAGVPEEQVVVMKPSMTDKRKLEIFDKVNAGEVRVIMGSTFTLGTGVNIQERLHTLIHLDAPNRPMDYTQRNGRIMRQGNLHKEWGLPVRVLRFGVEDSLDVTAYQRLKTKGAIADSIMNGKQLMENSMENRSLEEDQDLFGDITAQLSGSEYAMLKNQIEKEVRKLSAEKKRWETDQTYIHNRKRQIAEQNKAAESRIAENKSHLEKIEAATIGSITVGKLSFASIDDMGEFFTEQNKNKAALQEQVRTSGYSSRPVTSDITISIGGFDFKIHTEISRETKQGQQGDLFYSAPAKMTYSCPALGINDVPVKGNVIKNAVADIIENVVSGKDFSERIEYAERSIERNNAELQSMAAREGVPFKYSEELAKAQEKLDEYEELMKAEMAAKEAKYAEMDKGIEAATNVELTEEDSEPIANEPSLDYSSKSFNFVSSYETKDGKTINYTSENPEVYGGLFGGDIPDGENTANTWRVDRRQRTVTPIQRRNATLLDTSASDRLNKANGEYCALERKFRESNYMEFTSAIKVESADDIAFIFEELENASVENVFAVMTKRGVPTVLHISIGGHNWSAMNQVPIKLAYDRIKPDKVYFVHNHPSGALECSPQDVVCLRRLEGAIGKKAEGIIINLKSGKYGTFDSNFGKQIRDKAPAPIEQRKLRLYAFDRHVFNPDYQPSANMRNSDDIAKFISSHRLGDRSKVSILVCNNQNQIVANVHTTHVSVKSKGLADDIVRAIAEFGGMKAFLYGDFEREEGSAYNVLSNAVKERSGEVFTLLDVVRVEGNNTWSARDEGYLAEPGSIYGASPDGDIRFREVDDEGVLTEFAEGKTVKAYRTMQVIDGELYSPMATKVGGKETPVIKLGVPEQSEEHPELIKGKTMGRDGSEYGLVVIDKGQGKGTLTVAFNPYMHASRTALNDQFTSAHARPNLVTVEVEIPVSELTSGYRANMAKDAVGEMSWHSGTVSGQLSALGKPRRVILSRYDRPVRIVPYREVAEMIAKQLEGTDIEIPYNVVQPQVRAELERLGVRISEKASGTVGDEADFGKAEYVTDQQIERINARQKEMAQTSHEAKSAHAERLSQKLNTKVRIVNDVNEITHHNAEMQERMRKSKGWFDPSTGKVVIVLPNNRNVEDVAATVFHEVVAHKGLREMVGEEGYDAFCDEIYKHLNKKLKQQIDEETTRRFMNDPKTEHEKHRRVAIDEMFGRLSEKGFEDFTREERSIWMKIRTKVLEAINKFLSSLKLPKWVTLGDNELRYMLWRSHERLTGKSNYVDMARDVAKRNELGLANDIIFKMGDKPETFEERQRRAVEQRGVVMPGLNNAKVKVVEVPRHGFTGRGIDAINKARTWAEGNLVGAHTANQVGNRFEYGIDNDAIKKFLSSSSTLNSDNLGVHLAVLTKLTEIIDESIEVEEHPDYRKNAGQRSAENGIGDNNLLVHRMYGAVNIDGTIYRVKTTMHERSTGANAPHDYRVTKIELFVSGSPTSNARNSSTIGGQASSIDVAKLLKGIEKSYDKGKKILDESKKADESGVLFRDGERKKDETEDIWQDHSMGFEERLTSAKIRLSEFQRDDKTLRNDAIEAINADLSSLRRAMSAQKQFDKATVKRVADLARILIQNNYLAGMTSYEVKRLLSAVKNSVGYDDVKNSVQKVLDIMVDNQLRIGEESFERLLKTKGSKVDSRGVEVQAGLDVNGQEMLATLREAIGLSEDAIRKRLDEALADINDPDQPAKAAKAENDYFGLSFALEYIENIKASKDAEKDYRDQLKNAKAAKDDDLLTKEEYLETKEAIEEAIRKNKIDQAVALCQLVGRLSNAMRESKANAMAFREAEKARIEEIRHNANSDMEGRKAYAHIDNKDFWQNSWVNNSLIQWATAPLATFDQMLRMFGNKSANGEGYLWNRFMRGYVDCRNKELTGLWNKYKQMDQKAEEIFGKGMTWTDVIANERKFGTVTISFKDGKELRTFDLTQGNMLAIYMWNKMTDGRMKLRAMGISEADVERITASMDPRFKQLGDWIQEEFLPSTREEYNATHKRMFGAPMATIEDYFPLVVLKNDIEEKNSDSNKANDKGTGISTKTGSVIKRTVNIHALDVTGTDALKLIIDHIAEMEHWNAFVEYKRDMNTLLTYKRFRNQVFNMQSIYGGGTKLWEEFENLCKITVGEYEPKEGKYEKSAVNISKAVTASKISFRINTAIKQLLSMPAYIPEVSTVQMAKSLANPYGDFKWCLENMPIFRERWHSRIAGDPRLLKTDKDWKIWRSKVLELASRYGMAPNAFVDAVTVAIGARAMYNTRLNRYLKDGYEHEDADARAKQDAVILFNQTQQSSEAPFLSQMQVDRTWFSVLLSVFRNASMSYTRQTYDALRNLKRNATPEQWKKSVEFMTKQILRDWNVDPDSATSAENERAAKAARSRLRRQIKKDLIRLAVFNCILPGLWVAGGYMSYLLLGDDDDKKEQMLEDVAAHTLFGGIEGLALGDLMGNGLSMLYTGSKDVWKLGKEMPFVADIKKIWEEFEWGNTAEMTSDIVNLVLSSVTGVNPQTLTDVVAATMDICGDDPELSHETAIFVARVINCPRSQIEELYFDEIGLSGEEASKLTPTQLAERYAKYRVKRGAAPWSWDNEDLLDKYERRALRQIKERMKNTGDSEVLAAYTDFEERHNAIEKRLNELKPLKKEDYEAYVDGMTELREDPDYYTSKVFGILDDDLSDIAKMWLKAETPEQAALCCETMAKFREKMVWALQGENVVEQYQRAGAARSMLSEFRYRYRALQ